MKISSVPNTTVPFTDPSGQSQSKVDTYRSLKMTTNATPLANQQPDVGQNSETPDTQASVEATQPLSPQLALLARQRRALQVKERELRTREKALLSQNSGTSMIDVARLKSEPLSVLLENGVTYDQLTEAIMRGQGNTEINALKAELAAMKQGIDQKFVEKDTNAEKQVLAEMRREADVLIKGDDYELVRETNSVPTALDLVKRTYHSTGEVLDMPEALRLVEDELFKDMQKITKLKKMQQQSPAPLPQQRETGMRTLTNRDTASVPLSAKARAMAAFYGTLKK